MLSSSLSSASSASVFASKKIASAERYQVPAIFVLQRWIVQLGGINVKYI
jgi:hypothetical protein